MLIDLPTAKRNWISARWPSFQAVEMACRCCGEVWWSPADFDAAQALRDLLARPVRFNSTHRCRLHNARIGGAPMSAHKKVAFDFSLTGINQSELLNLQSLAKRAGFGSFGLYRTFIHMDRRCGRFWVSGGKEHQKYFRSN